MTTVYNATAASFTPNPVAVSAPLVISVTVQGTKITWNKAKAYTYDIIKGYTWD